MSAGRYKLQENLVLAQSANQVTHSSRNFLLSFLVCFFLPVWAQVLQCLKFFLSVLKFLTHNPWTDLKRAILYGKYSHSFQLQ